MCALQFAETEVFSEVDSYTICDQICFEPESQKPSWHHGIAIRKVFCAKPLKLYWEDSGQSGKFPDGLESFRMI